MDASAVSWSEDWEEENSLQYNPGNVVVCFDVRGNHNIKLKINQFKLYWVGFVWPPQSGLT